MKKFAKVIIIFTIVATLFVSVGLLFGCNKNSDKTITVCASDVPHAEILEGVVKNLLKDKGYDLKVTIMDWQEQNGAVAAKDYDANYFQHLPYLLSGDFANSLAFTCKVHYEPLGIYVGGGQVLSVKRTVAICNDESNAVRALQLLEANNFFSKADEGDNYPITTDGKLAFASDKWTSTSGSLEVTLIAENTLVSSMPDYNFVCLPCNTALTGNVSAEYRAFVESDPAQVSGKANGLAVRKAEYLADSAYKAKIDALTDVLLSKEVADYVKTKYNGVIICDAQTQIDMRGEIK